MHWLNYTTLTQNKGFSNKVFIKFLDLINQMLTSMNELPNSTYEVKKELIQFTMEYIKIYAFPNECILYRKQYENASQYTECGTSR